MPDVFATLKHNLKDLHFVPMSRRRVVDGCIYRVHGWPDLERYRREDCLKAIYKTLRENFPGEEYEEDVELLGVDG
ncbi:hypothetical protein B0H63DRAFT_518193 [Podospora didyma]|uniref:Uncharacterized protein n=1 Tax=Podospora didyma TaxID=330526 RepID=A0AAE0U963_9PEZI|nr:hypothetical protein B0H63DRAFT_518193 [Podospora didyma]